MTNFYPHFSSIPTTRCRHAQGFKKKKKKFTQVSQKLATLKFEKEVRYRRNPFLFTTTFLCCYYFLSFFLSLYTHALLFLFFLFFFFPLSLLPLFSSPLLVLFFSFPLRDREREIERPREKERERWERETCGGLATVRVDDGARGRWVSAQRW
jgi:hypothetical protein